MDISSLISRVVGSSSTPMTLGNYVFEVEGFGFSGLERSTETRWAEMNVAGGMNPIQWTGGGGEYVTISGVLFPKAFGGMTTLESIRTAARAGTIMTLIALSGEVFGQFVVEGVDDSRDYIAADGSPRRTGYSLRLRRYFASGIAS
ncbi:MAG: phage tail protein [Acetobacter sp.]|nr:phage tail protein [Acetobacter sp.]